LRVGRILRISRMLRLKKAREIMMTLAAYFRGDHFSWRVIMPLFKMLVILSLECHWIACAWYLVLRESEHDVGDCTSSSMDTELPIIDRYMTSLHWAVAMFWGEHDSPCSTVAKMFVISILILNFTLQIWFVSFITTAMTHVEIVSSTRSRHIADLNRFMADRKVAKAIALRVERTALFVISERNFNTPEDEVELLRCVSEPLMAHLHFNIYSQIISVHPFFKQYCISNPVGMRKLCHLGIKELTVDAEDMIFELIESNPTPVMYFVISGELEYHTITQKKVEVREVTKQHWLCEPILWTDNWEHRGMLKATTRCRLVEMKKSTFQEVISGSDPGAARKYAVCFVNYLNTLSMQEQSDIGQEDLALKEIVNNVFQPF